MSFEKAPSNLNDTFISFLSKEAERVNRGVSQGLRQFVKSSTAIKKCEDPAVTIKYSHDLGCDVSVEDESLI